MRTSLECKETVAEERGLRTRRRQGSLGKERVQEDKMKGGAGLRRGRSSREREGGREARERKGH